MRAPVLPRRALAAGAALALALGLSPAHPGWAVPTIPVPAGSTASAEQAFELQAGSGIVTVAGRERSVVAVLPATEAKTFSMLGVTWQGSTGGEPQVQFRARAAGVWSAWTSTSGQVDNPSTGKGGTEPLFIGDSDAVEIRVLGDAGATLTGGRLTLLTPQQVAADSAPQKVTAATSPTGVPGPTVITRKGWGADESLLSWNGSDCVPGDYDSTIKAVIVHHTEGSNSYTKEQSAGIVRSTYAYHVKERGWCDIGYNMLVDKYGQVFEGRHGGLLHPVHGAHAGSWNTNTFGISMMMNSNTAKPTEAALAAYTRAIAWKLANNYVPPTGRVTIAGRTINTIEMHGTVMDTDCPGTNLRAYMPTLRSRVATAMTGWNNTPIYKRWTALGGAGSTLGAPYVMEHDHFGGRRTIFRGGTIWQDTSARTFWSSSLLADAATSVGQPTTGWPTADQSTLGFGPAGSLRQPFQNGAVYGSPTTGGRWVPKVLNDWLLAHPAAFRNLGLPTGPAVLQSDGSTRQQFQNGVLVSNATGIVSSNGLLKADGRTRMLMVDGATNSLWTNQVGADGVLTSPRQIGRGWGDFTWISQVPDQNKDGITELAALRRDGTLWLYNSNGISNFSKGQQIGRGWSGMRNLTVMPDMDGDGFPEMLAIDSSAQLRTYGFNTRGGFLTGARVIGWNWQGIRLTATVGSFVGASTPDLLAVTTDGKLRVYEMDRTGRTIQSTLVGTGWSGMSTIYSPGDLNADGARDLVGRRYTDGNLFAYLNNRAGGWQMAPAVMPAQPYRMMA